MAEERAFAAMLQDKEKSATFDLHKIDRDSKGVEKTRPVDKDAVATQTKMAGMAREVLEQIYGQTFDERVKWTEEQRKKGNAFFKQEKFNEALDEYMKCLCALDFKSCRGYLDETTGLPKENDKDLEKALWIDAAREQMAQLQMKIPCLNNMAQSLIRLGQHGRAADMCDQVLELDAKNAKATARKLQCLMTMGKHEQAEKLMRYTSNTIDSFNSGPPAETQTLRQTLDQLKKELAEKLVEEKKFMQNVFKKSGALYEDKTDIKTPEQLEAESEERKLATERMEEAEYLETLGTFHWLVYPWFKMMETACDKVFGCKRRLDEENNLRRAEVQANQEAKEQARRAQMEQIKKKQA